MLLLVEAMTPTLLTKESVMVDCHSRYGECDISGVTLSYDHYIASTWMFPEDLKSVFAYLYVGFSLEHFKFEPCLVNDAWEEKKYNFITKPLYNKNVFL
ncbi:hypothetical protein Q9966_015189 [Columba livia]|nr:hypothetical protein Q9966_015189 [Columba livia]